MKIKEIMNMVRLISSITPEDLEADCRVLMPAMENGLTEWDKADPRWDELIDNVKTLIYKDGLLCMRGMEPQYGTPKNLIEKAVNDALKELKQYNMKSKHKQN